MARHNRHTAEQSWVPQPSWGHFWENMFKKGNTRVKVEEEYLHGTLDIPCSPWRMPQWSTRIFLKELKPMESPHQSKDMMRKKAERHHYVLAATPLPLSMWACMARLGDVRNRAEPGGRGRKGVLFWISFSLPESILVGNKTAIFSQTESVLPAMVIGKQLPCFYLNLLFHCFCFSYFTPLHYQTEGGGLHKQAAGWKFCCWSSLAQHKPLNRNDSLDVNF